MHLGDLLCWYHVALGVLDILSKINILGEVGF